MGHQFSPCTAVGVISDEAPAAPYRCRQEPLQDMVAGLVVVPGSVVYCGPDLLVRVDVHACEACTLPLRAGCGRSQPPGYPASVQTASQWEIQTF